jgi:hypothetical protein
MKNHVNSHIYRAHSCTFKQVSAKRSSSWTCFAILSLVIASLFPATMVLAVDDLVVAGVCGGRSIVEGTALVNARTSMGRSISLEGHCVVDANKGYNFRVGQATEPLADGEIVTAWQADLFVHDGGSSQGVCSASGTTLPAHTSCSTESKRVFEVSIR